MTFQEITNSNGVKMACAASDNMAEYILTSACAKDMHAEYIRRWERLPSSAWYRRNFSFERVK